MNKAATPGRHAAPELPWSWKVGDQVTILNEALVGTVTEYPAVDPDGTVHPDSVEVRWSWGAVEIEGAEKLYSAVPADDDTVTDAYRTYDGDNLAVDTRISFAHGGLAMVATAERVSTRESGDYEYVSLSPDMAREVGTFIVHCAGNPSLHGEKTWTDEFGSTLRVFFEDGMPTFDICDTGRLWTTTPLNTIDLGQRLIIWAGPDLTHQRGGPVY